MGNYKASTLFVRDVVTEVTDVNTSAAETDFETTVRQMRQREQRELEKIHGGGKLPTTIGGAASE